MTTNTVLTTKQHSKTILPVIKWTGSKRSQAQKIISMFPKFKTYYEPFLGGGSIMVRTNAKNAICGDICKPLIDFYKLIRDNPDNIIKSYTTKWNKLQSDGSDIYYDIRGKFNKNNNPHDLLFLSRTCVNGLIRFNKSGEFNNAFHHTRPGINPETLANTIRQWSGIIKHYKFVHKDYSNTTLKATTDDFVYLDPPYFNTRGIYYGTIPYDEFLDYLESLNSRNIKFAMSFDGTRGSNDFTVDIPKKLYKRKLLLDSGNSPFRNVMNKKVEMVKESLYLNF